MTRLRAYRGSKKASRPRTRDLGAVTAPYSSANSLLSQVTSQRIEGTPLSWKRLWARLTLASAGPLCKSKLIHRLRMNKIQSKCHQRGPVWYPRLVLYSTLETRPLPQAWPVWRLSPRSRSAYKTPQVSITYWWNRTTIQQRTQTLYRVHHQRKRRTKSGFQQGLLRTLGHRERHCSWAKLVVMV